MATKKTNGHDPATVEMVDLLRQLVTEARETKAELAGFRKETNERLATMDGRLEQLVVHAHATNEHFDVLRKLYDERLANHERRLEQLESRLRPAA